MRGRPHRSGLPGKVIGGCAYLHRTLFGELDVERIATIREAEQHLRDLGITRMWTIAKLDVKDAAKMSLLDYEDFELFAFPALRASARVDLKSGAFRMRVETAKNPPILHRKELLLPIGHPSRLGFLALTSDLERRGLYDNMVGMGRRKQWQKRLHASGIRVDDTTHRVVEI